MRVDNSLTTILRKCLFLERFRGEILHRNIGETNFEIQKRQYIHIRKSKNMAEEDVR